MSIDRIDQQILALLSKDARVSNKEIAYAVGLAPSSVHERTKRLFEDGLVIGAYADIDLSRLGLSLKAMLFIQMSEHEKSNLKRFLNELLQIDEVLAGWMVTGRFDAIIELVARDTNHLHSVVVEKFSSRPEISRIETSVVFESERHCDLSGPIKLALEQM